MPQTVVTEATPIETLQLFRRELRLCALPERPTVAIYSEAGQRRDYADAWAIAAAELGAEVVHVDLPVEQPRRPGEIGGRTTRGLAQHRGVVELLKQCDLVIDLALLLFTHEQEEIKAAGTRVLVCIEPLGVIRRLFPTPDQRRRSNELRDILQAARTIRVESDAGTDVVYELGDYLATGQYGVADEPGRWDHFPSTHAATLANDGSVNGTIVMQPGDIVLPFCRYVVEPIRFTIREGRVVDVGGGADAALLRSYYDAVGAPRGYEISHIGFGLNENARWEALAAGAGGIGMDARAFLGSVLWSTGPNLPHGGDNSSPFHLDLPMLDCSFWADDELLVDRGRVVRESLLPDSCRDAAVPSGSAGDDRTSTLDSPRLEAHRH